MGAHVLRQHDVRVCLFYVSTGLADELRSEGPLVLLAQGLVQQVGTKFGHRVLSLAVLIELQWHRVARLPDMIRAENLRVLALARVLLVVRSLRLLPLLLNRVQICELAVSVERRRRGVAFSFDGSVSKLHHVKTVGLLGALLLFFTRCCHLF